MKKEQWHHIPAGFRIGIVILCAVVAFVIELKSCYPNNAENSGKSNAANVNNVVDNNNSGNAYAADKDMNDQAIEDSTAALSIDPNDARAYAERGRAYYYKRMHDHAIEDFNAALRIGPNSAEIYSLRGNAYYYKKMYDKAIEDFTAVLRINPNDDTANIKRGHAYYDKGMYNRAIEDFNAALRINPNNADAKEFYALAVTMLAKSQYEATTLFDLELWGNKGEARVSKKFKATVEFNTQNGPTLWFEDTDGRTITTFEVTKHWPSLKKGQRVTIYFTATKEYGWLQSVIDDIEF